MSDLMRRRAMMQGGDDYLKGWEFNKGLDNKRRVVDAIGYCLSPFLEVDPTINKRCYSAHYFTETTAENGLFYIATYRGDKTNIAGSAVNAESQKEMSTTFIPTETRYVRLVCGMARIDDCYFRYNNGPYLWAGKNVKQ